MKVCNVCYIDLPNSSFDTYYSRKVKGEKTTVLKPSCKSCEKEKWRKYRVWMRTLVGRWKMKKGCARCDFKAKYSYQLDLDHLDRNTKRKVNGTHRAFEVTWSKKRVKAELSKCQVLCKNCHAFKSYCEDRNEDLPNL